MEAQPTGRNDMKTNHRLQASASRSTRKGVWAVVVLALALVLVSAFASSARADGFTPKICGTFSGPHWSYKGHSGTQYVAYTLNGGSCSFSLTWAQRLVDKHALGKYLTIIGSPPGWACGNASVASFGLCAQGPPGHPVKGGKLFAWKPQVS
jgi:hypothetical protein